MHYLLEQQQWSRWHVVSKLTNCRHFYLWL